MEDKKNADSKEKQNIQVDHWADNMDFLEIDNQIDFGVPQIPDKYSFFIGVLNIVVIAYLAGGYTYAFVLFYTFKFPILMILRYFEFRKD